jgi:hypothetical protein
VKLEAADHVFGVVLIRLFEFVPHRHETAVLSRISRLSLLFVREVLLMPSGGKRSVGFTMNGTCSGTGGLSASSNSGIAPTGHRGQSG